MLKSVLINLKKFLSTSRYDKPHGILFLFYPCIWGISLTKVNILEVYKLCIIFFIGFCGMRALGCIWNDLNDKRFDILVNRTKKRLIALGKVSKSEAVVYMIINFLIGSIPLFFIGKFGIILCLIVIPLIVSYPFMKRITWWPQLWLGINFNWGVLVGYYALEKVQFHFEVLLFYLGCVFWTLAYDTIYGYQDIKDDLKVGIKSTSIKFQKKPSIFILLNYLLCYLLWLSAFYFIFKDYNIIVILSFLFSLLTLSVFATNFKNPISCEKSFKRNSYFGLSVTLLLCCWNINI